MIKSEPSNLRLVEKVRTSQNTQTGPHMGRGTCRLHTLFCFTCRYEDYGLHRGRVQQHVVEDIFFFCTSLFDPLDVCSTCKNTHRFCSFHCTNRQFALFAQPYIAYMWTCVCMAACLVPTWPSSGVRGLPVVWQRGESHVPCRMRWLVWPSLSQQTCRVFSGLYQSDVWVNLC